MARNQAGRFMVLGTVIGLLILVGVGAYYVYPLWQQKSLNNQELSLSKDERKAIFVRTGWNEKQVADELLKQNIISDKADFLSLSASKNYGADRVKPGMYVVQGDWKLGTLINRLINGNGRSLDVKFSTDNVWTVEQMVSKICQNLELDSSELINYLYNEATLNKYGFSKKTLPSLFFANTYQNDWAVSKEDWLKQMAEVYKSVWSEERKIKANKMGMEQSEVYTLASIVYGECGMRAYREWPTVAGLYLNRIAQGIRLQSDPTVKYANELYDLKRVYYKHLEIDHPYNTYKIKGLPPGPIKIIPSGVIDAVLNHEKHNYLYMCAKGYEIGHNFAATLTGHNKNVAKYRVWQEKNNNK